MHEPPPAQQSLLDDWLTLRPHHTRSHLEHLPGALTVTGTEDGRVHILEASVLKEGVCGV